MANHDARNLLNALELAVETTHPSDDLVIHITLDIAQESIQKRTLAYDKKGDNHYDTISAFIKSVRGSDPMPPSTGWQKCSPPVKILGSFYAAGSSGQRRYWAG
jgi:hypothetical protein